MTRVTLLLPPQLLALESPLLRMSALVLVRSCRSIGPRFQENRAGLRHLVLSSPDL